ncbi:MAG: MOSC domain-containing protein [Alphaproteobacteria bacterium]|nr:MOSC domain-containing protein [Alphaproteobacteria bacterium]
MIVGDAGRVSQIRIGRAKPFGPKGQPSAIDKLPVAGLLDFGPLGLYADDQGDLVHHGGKDKAIHAYPRAHYSAWADELPELRHVLNPGAFGENLVIDELTECDVCLGDIFALGTGRCQVSQSRQPCWKLNHRFGRPDMSRLVQESGRTGWYFRVLEGGSLMAGTDLILLERPHPEWPLSRVHELLYRNGLDRTSLAELALLPTLPPSWRSLAERRLASGRIEDWTARLATPE